MTTGLFYPVLTAETQALSAALHSPRLLTEETAPRAQQRALLQMLLPAITAAPGRLQRLHETLVAWLLAESRTWHEVEQARQELQDTLDTQIVHVEQILAAGTHLGLAVSDSRALHETLLALRQLRANHFQHWTAYTPAAQEEARREIQQGRFHDLDEVLRELQSRPH